MVAYHNPVLLKESVDALNIRPNGIYADLTFGGGGHTREILSRLDADGRLIAFDQDPDAIDNLPQDDRLTFVHHNFKYLRNFLRLHEALPIDGILADLGISSHQIDELDRGFSTRGGESLDMRMSQSGDFDAIHVLNTYDEYQLSKMFRLHADLKNAKQLARQIVSYRNLKEITNGEDLKECISHLIPRGKENSFMAKVYQAIRIEVNDELGVLSDMLKQLPLVLKPGGRISIISYHSLEDRMVKELIRSGNPTGETDPNDLLGTSISPFKAISRKPIVAEDSELESNPRSRSAKLRIAERR